MRRRTALGFLMIGVAIAGVVFLGFAAATAYDTSTVSGKNFRAPAQTRPRVYDCGSVLSPKDIRNLVPKRQPIPLIAQNNYKRCEALRDKKGQKAFTYLLVGSALVIIAFVVPAVMHSVRRRRSRPRRTYAV